MERLNLKPTHKPVQNYYEALRQFKTIGVAHEGAVRSAFQTLLEHCGRQFGWKLVPEWQIKRNHGHPLRVDGALVDEPDAKGNWLTEGMHDEFQELIPLGEKQTTSSGQAITRTLFQLHSNGVKSNRDGWVYNFSRDALRGNVKRTIDFYNEHVSRWSRRADGSLDNFVINDDTRISWSRDMKADLSKGRFAEFAEAKIRSALYRPFTRIPS